MSTGSRRWCPKGEGSSTLTQQRPPSSWAKAWVSGVGGRTKTSSTRASRRTRSEGWRRSASTRSASVWKPTSGAGCRQNSSASSRDLWVSSRYAEQFTAELMLALSRSGRQAEALRAYAHLRSHLNEELGLDCSPALSRLEGDILRGEVDRGVPSARGRTGRLAIRGYELRERTSVSALGSTYRAYQASEGREVLVTALAPALADDVAFVGRCQARTRQLAEIEQRGLVPVYDFWREPEGAFLVSPVVRGRTVEEALADGWLTVPAAVAVVADVSAALSAAHRRGLVHGSISPRSVVIDDEGRGLLTDFGPAPLDHGGDDDRFVAPERLAGGPPTALGDVFSLAKVFEHSVGASPPDGGRPAIVLSPGVADAVAGATAVDLATRFADAQQFSDAIRSGRGRHRGPGR